MALSAFVMLLDYRGGTRTDGAVERLCAWNPGRVIHVLDNGSSDRRSRYVTHMNAVNSYPGGGIRDCLTHAWASGATHLMFIVNDVDFETPVLVSEYERRVDADPSIVQISAAITTDSAQALRFPWMIARDGGNDRTTGHADLLVSLLDLGFVEEFGGFPESKGGWGYPWELAYHADRHAKRIVVMDSCVVRHGGEPQAGQAQLVRSLKSQEAASVYRQKYGEVPWTALRARLEASAAAGHRALVASVQDMDEKCHVARHI